MKIGFGSDHGGIELKDLLIQYVSDKGFETVDYGTNSNESVDYPLFAANVAKAIIRGDIDRGIICCGTGIGISISANKFPKIRFTDDAWLVESWKMVLKTEFFKKI